MSEVKKVTLKVADVVTADFQQSFDKLKKTPTLAGETAFKLVTLSKKIKETRQNYHEARDEYLRQASIDEKTGEPTITGFSASGDPTYGIKNEKVSALTKKIKEIGEVTIEIDEFKYSDLRYTDATPDDDRKISAFDIDNLGFVVKD